MLSLFSEHCSQTCCFPFNICEFDFFFFLKSDTLHLSLLNFMLLISDPFFNFLVSFCIQILLSKVFAAPLSSVSYAILKSFLPIPSSKLKILSNTGPKTDHCGILFDMFSQFDNKPLITAFPISPIFQTVLHPSHNNFI